jgi:Flp pilus assembly protein TadG
MKKPSLRSRNRRGTIAPLTLVLMIVLLACVAFAIDVGYLAKTRNEMQRTADAAAIAAAWDLISEESLTGDTSMSQTMVNVRGSAVSYTSLNDICKKSPDIDENTANDVSGDVVVGYLNDLTNPAAEWDYSDPTKFNAVQLRVSKTSQMNGEIPLFFARVLGMDSRATTATATAALTRNIGGFRIPADGGNVQLLPFALDIDTWNDLMNGTATDSWTYDPDTGAVCAGSDGIKEVNLYPQGTGSPGNRGTVDIGGSNNSTTDIARQIVEGVSPDDLAHHGGELEFDSCGELDLNGDTGISAGVKDELASIVGDPRMIPIFEEVNGPGNNADYTIVKFAGVRIMEVKLTGKMTSKRLIIQPCNIVADGVIPTTQEGHGDFIYTPVRLIR